MIGPQGLDINLPAVKFDFVFTPDQLNRVFGNDEIFAHYFPGYSSKEIAFLHVPSKTLVTADLAENLPAKEQYSQTGEDPRKGFRTGLFIKIFSPNIWLHNFAIWHVFTKDKKYDLLFDRGLMSRAMKRDVKVVSEWNFDRLIVCHGDVVETGAKKYWNDLYVRFQ